METADAIDRPECWNRLAQQALKQGNHKVRPFKRHGRRRQLTGFDQIVEKAYQRTKSFDRLSFLYLATGNTNKLIKMQKIVEARGDQMSRFHNALYLGDVQGSIRVLRDVGCVRFETSRPLIIDRTRLRTKLSTVSRHGNSFAILSDLGQSLGLSFSPC